MYAHMLINYWIVMKKNILKKIIHARKQILHNTFQLVDVFKYFTLFLLIIIIRNIINFSTKFFQKYFSYLRKR